VSKIPLARDFEKEALVVENAKLHRQVDNLNGLLADQGHRLLVKEQIIADLRERVDTQDERIATLEVEVIELVRRLKKLDPSTSSTPPSMVPRHKRRYPTKEKSGLPAGRKPGTPGKAPEWNPAPDRVVSHRPAMCANGHVLGDDLVGVVAEIRQAKEIEVRVVTEEHHAISVCCPECFEATRGEFPSSVPARVCWGESVKALALLLTQRAFLPTQASANTLAAMGVPVSKGCLDQWRKALAAKLDDVFMPKLKVALLLEPWLGFDETPVNVNGSDTGQVHVATNGKLTHYHLGNKSLDAAKGGGLLGCYKGVAVTDSAPMYFSSDAGIAAHQLCCLHLIRELKCITEVFEPGCDKAGIPLATHPHPWAHKLTNILKAAIAEELTPDETKELYQHWVDYGLRGLSPPTKKTSDPLRDSWNLLTRLRGHIDAVLLFQSENCPPTNNASEQAVKPHKVRQRRSGCFRSEEAAREYLVVQSYLRSAVLSGVDPLVAIRAALANRPWSPAPPT
jgi:transposase